MSNEQRWQKLSELAAPDVVAALRSAYDYYDGRKLIEWVANLYDVEVGGFYYSNSARDYEPYRPDIESTSFALSLVTSHGAIKNRSEDLPENVQRAIVNFAKGLQSSNDGYFYHPQWPQGRENLNVDRYGRDIPSACNLIMSFWLDEDGSGVKRQQRPNFCAPGAAQCARHAGTSERCSFPELPVPKVTPDVGAPKRPYRHPDYSSREAFLNWVDEFNGGEGVKENSGNAHNLAELRYEIIKYGYYDAVVDYLDRIQAEIYDEQIAAGVTPSGVWQREVNYRAVWGLLKYLAFYNLDSTHMRKIDIKYVPHIIKTSIEVMKMPPDGQYHMNDIMNQWMGIQRVIVNVKKYYGDAEAEKIYEQIRPYGAELIANTLSKMAPFKMTDGSFSYKPDGHSLPRIYGTPISLGLVEGDLNAVILATNTYRCMFTCMGYDPVPMFTADDGKRFVEIISSLTPINKKAHPDA